MQIREKHFQMVSSHPLAAFPYLCSSWLSLLPRQWTGNPEGHFTAHICSLIFSQLGPLACLFHDQIKWEVPCSVRHGEDGVSKSITKLFVSVVLSEPLVSSASDVQVGTWGVL